MSKKSPKTERKEKILNHAMSKLNLFYRRKFDALAREFTAEQRAVTGEIMNTPEKKWKHPLVIDVAACYPQTPTIKS